jgi:hypothetical protein
MDGLALTLIFLFVLFLMLGSSVWIGVSLLAVAWVGMELFTSTAGRRCHGAQHLGRGVGLDADRPAAVRLDG